MADCHAAAGSPLLACLGALDRLGVGVGAEGYLDGLGLLLLGLGDADLKYAAVEMGLDAVGIDALGQCQRPGERAERPLESVVALLLVLVLGLALAGDRQHVVLKLNVHVAVGQSGEIGAQDVVVGGLD